MNKDIKLLYIDLFCGAGGTSTGVDLARYRGLECAKVITCVNHDKNAIASHAENHPDVLHFTEDIRTIELSPMLEHINLMREEYPNAFIVLWASLECTNFSKAKGGQPRDADSRTLAEHLFRYVDAIDPDYIQIENVEEFMSWGEMDENGKPISKNKGKSYQRWVDNVKKYGYKFDHRILNSADYGAYTSRKRFFGIFAKQGLPIVFPEQTHSKKAEKSLFGSISKWKPVKEVLDFSDEGSSVFSRSKDLSEKTLERIYAGLIKFVAGGKDKWILKYNSINGKTGKHIPPSIEEPCPTISCQGRLGLVSTEFLSRYNGGSPEHKSLSIEEPCGTVTTENRFAKVGVHFLSKQFSGHPDSKNVSIEAPAGAITCIDHHAFVSAYYGNGNNHDVNNPCPTITCKDRFSLISSHFLDMQYGNGTAVSVDVPAGTVTTSPKHNLVSIKPWVMNTNFNNVGSSIEEPSQVITANRKWHYLMNPQFASAGGSIDKPCFTLIARMDKMPPYLVATETGVVCIEVYDTDSPMTAKIKEFMAIYGIVDIKMRMLKIPELKRIMGFPEDYTLIGTQAEQKKFIGNAVEVNMARVLCEALCAKLYELNIKPLKIAA